LGLAWETLDREEEAAIEFEQALLLSDDLALKSLVEAHLQAYDRSKRLLSIRKAVDSKGGRRAIFNKTLF